MRVYVLRVYIWLWPRVDFTVSASYTAHFGKMEYGLSLLKGIEKIRFLDTWPRPYMRRQWIRNGCREMLWFKQNRRGGRLSPPREQYNFLINSQTVEVIEVILAYPFSFSSLIYSCERFYNLGFLNFLLQSTISVNGGRSGDEHKKTKIQYVPNEYTFF